MDSEAEKLVAEIMREWQSRLDTVSRNIDAARAAQAAQSAQADLLARGVANFPSPASGVEALEALKGIVDVFTTLDRLRNESLSRAQRELGELRSFSLGKAGNQPEEERSTLTLSLPEPISPAEFAELLMALETIHRELGGGPLRDLVAKIGLPEETVVHAI